MVDEGLRSVSTLQWKKERKEGRKTGREDEKKEEREGGGTGRK